MTDSIQKELATKIGARLHTSLGLTLIKGIVYQIAPDYQPDSGILLHGAQQWPFVSISAILPEQFLIEESTNVSAAIIRTLTVAIVADKAVAELNDDSYALYRQNAMRVLHTHRWTGTLTSDPNACIMHATVRPRSPIEQTAWMQYAKLVSAFDVLVQTDEPNTIT